MSIAETANLHFHGFRLPNRPTTHFFQSVRNNWLLLFVGRHLLTGTFRFSIMWSMKYQWNQWTHWKKSVFWQLTFPQIDLFGPDVCIDVGLVENSPHSACGHSHLWHLCIWRRH